MAEDLKPESTFLHDVVRLKPRLCDSTSTCKEVLEVFEAAGLVRPRVRVVVPTHFARCRAVQCRQQIRDELQEDEIREFNEISPFLTQLACTTDDPEQHSPLEEVPESVAKYVSCDPAPAPEDRAGWEVQVPLANGSIFYHPCVFSYYAPWQVLHFWVLIDSWTWEVMLAPAVGSDTPPNSSQVSPVNGLPALRWRAGGRFFRLMKRMEQDGWFQNLLAAEAARKWHDLRVYAPEPTTWAAGVPMSFEERVAIQQPLLLGRYRTYGSAWAEDLARFAQRVADLWEFCLLAQEERLDEVVAYVSARLHGAVRWMMGLYAMNFDQVCATVRPAPRLDRKLSQILRPAWYRTVVSARTYLQAYVDGFNEIMRPTVITKEDVATFVTYLDTNGLAIWCSEFTAMNDEYGQPTDLTWDHRIRAIASLASLCEPILLSLVERPGVSGGREKRSGLDNKTRIVAFLRGRAGAEDGLADLIDAKWAHLTQTTRKSLAQVLTEIEAANLPANIAGPAKVIFRVGAIRNFGSHRFDADPEWFSEHQHRLAQAVVLCPLLYWKLATQSKP